MGQYWERSYPIIISLLSVIVSIVFKAHPHIPGFEKVLDGVITFSSIVIGFLGALLAIILSISKSKVMQHLYQHIDLTNGRNLFYNYFKQAIIVGFLVVISSILMYIFRAMKTIPWYGKVNFYFWIFTTIFFLAASYRIISILMATLFAESKYANQDNEYQQRDKLSKEQIQALKEQASKK